MKFGIPTALVALSDQMVCGMPLRPTTVCWAAMKDLVVKSKADSSGHLELQSKTKIQNNVSVFSEFDDSLVYGKWIHKIYTWSCEETEGNCVVH